MTSFSTTSARRVSRAVADLRRGDPVRVIDTRHLLYFPVCGIDDDTIASLRGLAGDGMRLVLPACHAAVPSHGDDPEAAVCLRLPEELWRAEILAGLATAVRQIDDARVARQPAPIGARDVLRVLKLGQRLPVAIAVSSVDTGDAAAIEIGDVDRFLEHLPNTYRIAASARLPLPDLPHARLVVFRGMDPGPDHHALVVGAPERAADPLVRLHSECFTGDVFGSLRCDCGSQLHQAMRQIASCGNGVILYLAQEGRDLGLVNKLHAYALQDGGGAMAGRLDTLDANQALGYAADERDFRVAGIMLRALGLERIRLMTNNPRKIAVLTDQGFDVRRMVHPGRSHPVNEDYIRTKISRLGHWATGDDP